MREQGNISGALPAEVSFIIPVRNDAVRLRRCLTSVRQAARGLSAEIIVADNGSTDDSAAVAREAGATVLELPDRKVSRVRNEASAVASGRWLAFVDADNELAPTWGPAAAEAIRDPRVGMAGAQYHPPSAANWVQRTYDLLREHYPESRQVGWLPSGNMLISGSSFKQLGGFDETLETCEDVDLCQRFVRAGGAIFSIANMKSEHHGDPASLRALFRGELWRGRDALRVSLRGPLGWRSLIGAALPLATLASVFAIPVGLLAAPIIGWGVFAAGLIWLSLLTFAKMLRLSSRLPGGTCGPAQLAQIVMVSATYDVARALAPLANSGHRVRQRA